MKISNETLDVLNDYTRSTFDVYENRMLIKVDSPYLDSLLAKLILWHFLNTDIIDEQHEYQFDFLTLQVDHEIINIIETLANEIIGINTTWIHGAIVDYDKTIVYVTLIE